MGKIKKLKDKDGVSLYPVTVSDAVVCGDKTLTKVLDNKVDKMIASETYGGLYYGANGSNSGYFMPLHFFPKDGVGTNEVYRIKVRYTVVANGYADRRHSSIAELNFGPAGSNLNSSVWNTYAGSYLINTVVSEYPSANLATKGIHIGLGITSGNNYNSASYTRTVIVDLLEMSDNLTYSFDAPADLKQDVLMSWRDGSVTWTRQTYTASSQGLQETGDADTYTLLQSSTQALRVGADLPVGGYNLFGYSRDGKAQAISNYTNVYESYTASVNVNRYYNPNGFDVSRGLCYNASSTTYLKNTDANISARLANSGVDIRYSDNCVASDSANTLNIPTRDKRVYFRGVIKSDGLFYLAPIEVTYSSKTYKRAWVYDIPAQAEADAEGNPVVYWLIGVSQYNSSYKNNTYLVNLLVENPLYWYRDGVVKEITAVDFVNSGIQRGDLSAAVQASLAKADSAIQSHQDISGKADKAQLTDGSVTKVGKVDVGAANKPIYLKAGAPIAVSSVGEAFLSWGGQSVSGDVTPVDAAGAGILGNRLAFFNPSYIDIEYSRDGGSTWVDYGASDNVKTRLTTTGTGLRCGGDVYANVNNRLRITFRGHNAHYYSAKKFLVEISTGGSSQCSCLVETSKHADPTTFATHATFAISGDSGWNSIPFLMAAFGSTQYSGAECIRFTFFYAGLTTTYPNYPNIGGLTIKRIYGLGTTVHSTGLKNMANYGGHLYSYDADQNAVFPAKVTASQIVKSGGTSAQFLKADGSVDSAEYTPKTNAGADALLSTLPNWTATPSDGTKLIRRDTGNGASFGQVTFATVWSYISGKISSVLGLTKDNYGGKAATAGTADMATQDGSGNVIASTYAKQADFVPIEKSEFERLLSLGQLQDKLYFVLEEI